jgi:hypothetical protein
MLIKNRKLYKKCIQWYFKDKKFGCVEIGTDYCKLQREAVKFAACVCINFVHKSHYVVKNVNLMYVRIAGEQSTLV